MPVARMPVDHRRAIRNSFKAFWEQIDLSALVFDLENADDLQAAVEALRNRGPLYRAAVGAINGHLLGQLEDPAIVAELCAAFRTQFPDIKVIKSTKFMNADGKPLGLYSTRGRKRGVLLIFSYYEFRDNLEPYRNGADFDCRMLDQVFSAIGFDVIPCENFTMEETKECLERTSLEGYDSVFVVVSSHGNSLRGTGDTRFRTADGCYMLAHVIVDFFNSENRPGLKGIPKVFIFQMCRGNKLFPNGRRQEADPLPDAASGEDSRDPPARLYSDILIAYSTVPGYKSPRIGEQEQAPTWYMRAFCDVFAARAHACHVGELLALVDEQLRVRGHTHTCTCETWGFNRYLYLHPGLFEDRTESSRLPRRLLSCPPTVLLATAMLTPVVLNILVENRSQLFLPVFSFLTYLWRSC